MKQSVSRRQFVQATALAGAGLALPKEWFAAKKKSVLIFTKSSGFEHEVIKVINGRPSILEQAVKTLGEAIKKAATSDQFKTAITNIGDEVAYLDQASFTKFWDEDAKRVEAAVHAIGRVQG